MPTEDNQQKSSAKIGKFETIKELGVHTFHAILIGLFIFGGISVFNMFRPNKTDNTQKQSSSVVIAKGSGVKTVNISNTQQQTDPKRIVGLEGTVSSKDVGLGFVKYINNNWGVVVGGRYDYQGNDWRPEIKVRYDFY